MNEKKLLSLTPPKKGREAAGVKIVRVGRNGCVEATVWDNKRSCAVALYENDSVVFYVNEEIQREWVDDWF